MSVIGKSLAKSNSEYEDDQPLEPEIADDYGENDYTTSQASALGEASATRTEAGGSATPTASSAGAGAGAETSRNPYKWEEEGRASATSAVGAGAETSDLGDTVSSLAREGESPFSSIMMRA